jgi:hypothetical protein
LSISLYRDFGCTFTFIAGWAEHLERESHLVVLTSIPLVVFPGEACGFQIAEN